jgi:parallel beta-helix repeat protein
LKKLAITTALTTLLVVSMLLIPRTDTVAAVPAPPTPVPVPSGPVHNVNTGLNYTTVQAAIDAPQTLEGHTIRVDAGDYTEAIDVRKSLSINGAGADLSRLRIALSPATVPGDTIDVTADNVTIKGFTVESVADYSGILLDKVTDCDIANNIITGGGSGITLTGSSDNDITNNNIYSLPGNGIDIRDSSDRNEISSNNLSHNHYGIFVSRGSSYNVISANSIESSDWSGIRLNWQGQNYTAVEFNTVTNNIICFNNEGILLDYPSTNNFVSRNYVHDNSVGVRLRQATHNTMLHNTITSNNSLGISAESSNDNLIADNLLYNTHNAWDNGANRWNMAKICLISYPNIIEGTYTAGNYWSDNPNPVDADKDGLGDVAYNVPGGTNKDNLPLANKTQGVLEISNPQRDTWYRITRPLGQNGTLGYVDPLVIDLEAVGISPGGAYNWTVSVVGTCFGEPSLVSVRWLGPDKISLTWNPPPEPSLPWPWPWPWPPPWPYPPIDLQPWYFSCSVLNITCEYTTPGVASPVKDSVDVVVQYGLGEVSNVLTLTYGENILGIGNDMAVFALDIDEGTEETLIGGLETLCGEPIGQAIEIARELFSGTDVYCIHTPLNPNIDRNQSNTYMESWNLIDRTAAIIGLLPPPKNDLEKAERVAVEDAINSADLLEALRVTWYRSLWAEKVGDEKAMALQQSMFRGFFNEYIKCNRELEAALHGRIGELKKMGDIYVSAQNVSDFQAELWSSGFPTSETEIFNLFQFSPAVIEREKGTLCAYSPEKLGGSLSSRLTELINATRDGDQKMMETVYQQDNAIMDVTPSERVVKQGDSTSINVTVYVGVPAQPFNVTIYSDTTSIGSQTVTLTNEGSTTLTFTWNTAGSAVGNHTISAYATPVAGETDTADNTLVGGQVSVTRSVCFIATAAYGTATAEQVDVLREFRDTVLLKSTAGSQFVSLYYRLSPPIAEFISRDELVRSLVRELLVDPIVWIVEATGDIWRS